MEKCELCKFPARMYCESDQASLCWDCDAKVHGANFLVARHSRSLLCHACQSPTPWLASGAKLGPALSVCERCSDEGIAGGVEDNNDEVDSGSGDDIDHSDGDDEAESEEVNFDGVGDGGNQVVLPWSSSTPPPPVESSTESEDSSSSSTDANRDDDVSNSVTVSSLKRMRENASDLRLQDDDLDCSSSHRKYGSSSSAMAATTKGDDDDEVTCVVDSSTRPLKDRKTESVNQAGPVRNPWRSFSRSRDSITKISSSAPATTLKEIRAVD